MNRLDERRNAAEGEVGRASERPGPSSRALQKQIGALMHRLAGSPQQYTAKAMGPIAQAPLGMINTVSQLRQLATLVTAPHMGDCAGRVAGCG
jgi:hypothetical protein